MIRIRNVLRYLVAFALNIFIMLAFHSYVNLVLLVGMVLFPAYSIYGVYRAGQHLHVTLRCPREDMVKNEEFHVYVDIDNPTWFPLVNVTLSLCVENAFYGSRGEHELNVPLRAHHKTEIVYPVVMERCGHFVLTAERITYMDLSGMYVVQIPLKKQTECLVLPAGECREQEAGTLYQKGVSEAMESREKGYDFSDITGIREYIPGDKLQNIHWKLSTKKDELMVKERVSVSAMQLHVLVELANDEKMRVESVLQLADSITKAFVKQNMPFTVHYYSVKQGRLQQMYIGNEVEQRQWMELMLYDICYDNDTRAKELFLKEYPSAGSFLYIGLPDGADIPQDCMMGEQGVAAVLI